MRFGWGKKKRVPFAGTLSQVIPLGFEPKTHSLEGCCSIQLSYGTIVVAFAGAKLQKTLENEDVCPNFFAIYISQ